MKIIRINKLLKKTGVDYSLRTNKKKTRVVSALKNEFKVKELLKIINLKNSTYFYETKLINHDNYVQIRQIIKKCFFKIIVTIVIEK